MRVTVGTKLGLAFGVLTLLSLVIGAVAYVNLQALNAQIEDVGQRRSARISGAASKKILSSAWGKTTVPISRPSMTTRPPAPERCCSATRTSRTAPKVARREAACATSSVRIACVTSKLSRKTRFFAPVRSCSWVGGRSSICVMRANAASAASSERAI